MAEGERGGKGRTGGERKEKEGGSGKEREGEGRIRIGEGQGEKYMSQRAPTLNMYNCINHTVTCAVCHGSCVCCVIHTKCLRISVAMPTHLNKWETDKAQPQSDIEGSCDSGQLLIEVDPELGVDTADLIQGYDGCNARVNS